MSNTRYTYHLHSNEFEEIIKREGLPEEISTEAQLWDLIFKKAAYNSPSLLFPLIYEVYQKKYPNDSTITPLSTEYSVERADSKEISTIKADLTFQVNSQDIYHFECEITYNGLMTIRMFEYDVHAAPTFRKDSKTSKLILEFPKSAVLFLQGTRKIPKKLTCLIKFQDGSTHENQVPTIKVQSYSLEEIREKHLCLLIPFLPIRFRRKIPSDRKITAASSPEKRQALLKSVEKSKEELTSFFEETILILEDKVKAGFLTDSEKELILELLQKSMLRISYRNQNLCQKVYNMTEPVLKLRSDKYWEAVHERDALKKALDEQNDKLAEYKRLYGELKPATTTQNIENS